MGLNEEIAEATRLARKRPSAMGLDEEIAEATRLARRESEVHEATELLLPLAKRFRDVLTTLRHITERESECESKSEGEGVARETRDRAEKILEQAVRTLVYVVGRQKTLPLASRVLEAESLARDVAEMHGEKNEKGESVGGLDGVLAALDEQVDDNKWRRRLEQEKQEHVDLLRESMREVREVLGADESMARETIVLLKHAQAYGRWNALADELWGMVEPFAAPMDNQDHLLELPAWFIPESDIVFRSRMLDRGGFATIHNAMWDGCSVVVKVVQDINIHQTKQLKQLVTEVEIGYGLSHPHVIKMYGACHTRSPPLIVCEFAKYGNMSDYLHRYGQTAPKWRLLYEAALGLQFLHKNKIVHGDMKLNNILITADIKAKVGDFGLSRRRESPTASYLYNDGGGSDGGGAIRWRAPECFRTKPTFASDTYSFGMCIYEAIAGAIPYEEVCSNDVVKRMICDGELPRRPDSVDDEVWELIDRLTRLDPESRSSLRSVVGALKELSSRENLCLSGTLFATVESALMRKSTVSSLSIIACGNSNEVVETDVFGSVSEAVEALRQAEDPVRQLRALKWMFRNAIRRETYSQLYSDGGIPLLKRIAENMEAPFVFKLCAFDVLDSINNTVLSGSMTTLVKQIKAALHRPDEIELSALYDQITDETSHEGRLEAIELFSICCEQNLIDCEIDVNHIVLELLRLLKVDDAQVNATAAYALGYAANGSMARSALLRESIRPLVSMLQFSEHRSRQCASFALGNLAAHSSESRVAIAKAGGIPPLIELLKTGSDTCKQQAAGALGRVAFNSPENRVAIAKASGIVPLVEHLKTGSDACKQRVARALGHVAANSSENSVAIARAGAIVLLVELLKTGSDAGKQRAAYGLGNVAAISSENRVSISRAGAIVLLVDLLITGTEPSKERAANALGNIAANSPDNSVAVAKAGGIAPLVELLKTGSDACKQWATYALGNVGGNSPENSAAIAKAGGIVLLVNLVKTGSNACKQQASYTLGQVAVDCSENRVAIAKAGGIVPLVELLKTRSDKCKERAANALSKVALNSPENSAAIAKAGAIVPLVELLKTGSDVCKQQAARALGNVSGNSSGNRVAIAEAGGIVPLVELVKTGPEGCRFEAAYVLSMISLESSIAKEIVDAGVVAVLKNLRDDTRIGTHAKTILKNLGYGGIWGILS